MFVSHLQWPPRHREAAAWQVLLNALNPLVQISGPSFLSDATQPNNVIYLYIYPISSFKKNHKKKINKTKLQIFFRISHRTPMM